MSSHITSSVMSFSMERKKIVGSIIIISFNLNVFEKTTMNTAVCESLHTYNDGK